MRVLVVGAGAVGGFFGSLLLGAGRDVTFLVRPARAELLAAEGLVVHDGSSTTVTRAQTVTADRLGETSWDLVILTVKEQALEAAVVDIAAAVTADTLVLPLLNGMRHLDRLHNAFGDAVLGGVAVVASQLRPDGSIDLLGPDRFMRYGELAGALSPRIEAVDATLSGAGFDTVCSSDIVTDMWDKWIFLASAAALTTLLASTVGDITATEHGPSVAHAVIDECASVARASGVIVRPQVIDGARARLVAEGSPFTASLYRDMAAGRDVESDGVVADLVRRAAAHGLAVPLLAAASANLELYRSRRARG
ncbi:2-dehydropantoate 2-reductase [Williamsia sp. M5A3_1d]